MSDDLFSKLFELFNQPGPVNWKLAAEVARHLTGEHQPVEPWAAEEFRDLTRLAEFNVERVSPFRVPTAADVLPLDQRGWAERNLEAYTALVEPFSASVADEGPAAALFGQMAPAIIGLQAGSLVGSLATWVVAGFDAGLPPDQTGALTVVVPNIEALQVPGVDASEIRLWVAANEVAFRTMCEIHGFMTIWQPSSTRSPEASRIDPTKLGGLMMGGTDPTEIEGHRRGRRHREPAGWRGGRGAEGQLEAFFGAIRRMRPSAGATGLRICHPTSIRSRHRDGVREMESRAGQPHRCRPCRLRSPGRARQLQPGSGEAVRGRRPVRPVVDPTRMPSAAELADPTPGRRVLIDGWL